MPDSRRILAGHDARPRGRADRARGVPRGEPHSLRRQAIDIWRLVEGLRVVAADVHVAQVVGQDEDDVRPGRGLLRTFAARGATVRETETRQRWYLR